MMEHMGEAGVGLSVDERLLVQTFVTLTDTLVEGFDLVEFLSTLAERIVQLGIASEVGILLVDEAGDLQFVAASDERTELLELFQLQNHEGPCLDCFASGRAISVPDLAAEQERWPLFVPKALESGFRSMEAAPLRLRGAVLGAVNLFLADTGGISRVHLAVVQALADVVTIGVLQQQELDQAHVVAAQLQHALNSRISIEQAKGIIAEQAHVTPDAAFDLLRTYARHRNEKLAAVTRAVIEGALTSAQLAAAR
jgi:hypothetical protein